MTGWNPGADGQVNALAASGSTVYVGGNFDSVASTARAKLAAIDAANGNVLAWAPNPAGQVNGLRASGATLYAVGEFTAVGLRDRRGLAAFGPRRRP